MDKKFLFDYDGIDTVTFISPNDFFELWKGEHFEGIPWSKFKAMKRGTITIPADATEPVILEKIKK